MKMINIRNSSRELIGALGDLGTFLPIAFGLIIINKVDAVSLFLSTGLIYIAVGIYFRIPIPVQPLKATSALAMAVGASAATLLFVSFFMASTLLAINYFHLDRLLARLFSRQIIRGIQLGLAFILIKSGLKLLLGVTMPEYSNSANSLDLFQAFFLLFLPQIPLTLANAVYATADTAKTYFGERANKVTPRTLMVSLGLANLFSGLSGGIPLCHGSSGVTAHYRFGARTGLCSVLAGLVFIMIGFAFAFGFGFVVKSIPFSFLGLSLIYIGIKHAALIKDIVSIPHEFMIAAIIGLYSIISGNLALAFGIGIVIDLAISWPGFYSRIFGSLRRK